MSKSGSPRSRGETALTLRGLIELSHRSFAKAGDFCRTRYEQRKSAIRKARYEDAAVAVAIFYQIEENEERFEAFQKCYRVTFERELNLKKLARECFVFMYGDGRHGTAGTDATSLRSAIKDGVHPEDIPKYIKDNGGLQALLNKHREEARALRQADERTDRHALKIFAHAKQLPAFEQLREGETLIVKIEKRQLCAAGNLSFVVRAIKKTS